MDKAIVVAEEVGVVVETLTVPAGTLVSLLLIDDLL